MFIMRQHKNEMTVQYLAAALCGIIALFVILHWTRRLVTRAHPSPTPLTKPFVLASRSELYQTPSISLILADREVGAYGMSWCEGFRG